MPVRRPARKSKNASRRKRPAKGKRFAERLKKAGLRKTTSGKLVRYEMGKQGRQWIRKPGEPETKFRTKKQLKELKEKREGLVRQKIESLIRERLGRVGIKSITETGPNKYTVQIKTGIGMFSSTESYLIDLSTESVSPKNY